MPGRLKRTPWKQISQGDPNRNFHGGWYRNLRLVTVPARRREASTSAVNSIAARSRLEKPCVRTCQACPRAWSRPRASEQGSLVSLRNQLQRLNVQFLLRHQVFQSTVLLFKLLKTHRLGRLRPAVLVPPPEVARFARLKRLQHGRQVLPGVQLRVRVAQLADDFFRTVALPAFQLSRFSAGHQIVMPIARSSVDWSVDGIVYNTDGTIAV